MILDVLWKNMHGVLLVSKQNKSVSINDLLKLNV
jgi:hypothetical protein